MCAEFCDPTEDVLHAILESEWDHGRVFSEALKGKNQSVSRLRIYTRHQILAIFHRDLDLRGRSPPVATLELRVAKIEAISKKYFESIKERNRPALRVRIDSVPGNAAHAEIDGTISARLSEQLVEAGEACAEPVLFRAAFWVLRRMGLARTVGRLLAPEAGQPR